MAKVELELEVAKRMFDGCMNLLDYDQDVLYLKEAISKAESDPPKENPFSEGEKIFNHLSKLACIENLMSFNERLIILEKKLT